MIRLIKPNISQSEIDAVSRVLETGMVVSGPVVRQFEQLLADYLGISHTVCVSSGTAALHLTLLAAGIKPSDEVIVPAFTFPATANVVETVGAIPVFIDCQPGGVNLDVNKLESLINPKTRAIMPVHAFGLPVEIEAVMDIARRNDLPVIEDAACALGSKYKNKYCGTFGDFSAFSFHPRKLLTTGEGGVVATDDSHSASLIRSLRNHGYEDGDYNRPGLNYRMTDFQAAMGVSQLNRFHIWIEKRKQLAQTYRLMLSDIDWLTEFEVESWMEPNVQTFLFKVEEYIDRDSLINHLEANGIEATIGTYCVPLTRYYSQRYGFQPDDFPEAYDAYKRCLSLPLHNEMSIVDMIKVVESLKSFTKKVKKELV